MIHEMISLDLSNCSSLINRKYSRTLSLINTRNIDETSEQFNDKGKTFFPSKNIVVKLAHAIH